MRGGGGVQVKWCKSRLIILGDNDVRVGGNGG